MTAMTAQQIYDTFRQAAGTEMWQAAQQSASQLSTEMPTLAADIKRLQETMNEAWQGQAADVASEGAEPLALAYMNTADYLSNAQDLVGRQTDSFDSAARSVQSVPPEPTSVDVLNAALGAPDMQQQVTSYLAASQHNVDVYTEYHGASQYNTTNLPVEYGHISSDDTSIAEVGGTSTGTVTVPHTSRLVVHDNPAPRLGGATPERVIAATSAPRSPSNSIGAAPPSAPEPPSAPPTKPSGSVGPDPTGSGTSPEPQPATMPASDANAFTDPITPIFDLFGAGSRVARPTTVDGGPLFDGLLDPGQPNVPVGSRVTNGLLDPIETPFNENPGSMTTPPPALDEPAVAPMAGVPGRRRAGDDEEEHRIATYEEPDPNELFGVPELAVLPVIGE